MFAVADDDDVELLFSLIDVDRLADVVPIDATPAFNLIAVVGFAVCVEVEEAEEANLIEVDKPEVAEDADVAFADSLAPTVRFAVAVETEEADAFALMDVLRLAVTPDTPPDVEFSRIPVDKEEVDADILDAVAFNAALPPPPEETANDAITATYGIYVDENVEV